MNRERAKQLLPIIQAFAEGKAIEVRHLTSSVWMAVSDPIWSNDHEYRVTPEPKWRPWTKDEVPKVFMARRKKKFSDVQVLVVNQSDGDVVEWTECGFTHRLLVHHLLDLLVHVHEDGSETPCGVREEPKD